MNKKSSLHYMRSLIEASLDPLVTISAEGKIMDVNTATEKATGVGRNKLVGSDFSEYFTDPEKARAGYLQVFTQGYVTNYPLQICHVSGRLTDVLYNASVYLDEEGNVAGVFAAARDVTAQKRAEEQLRALSNYFRSLIEVSLDPLVTISAEGKIMDVNTATEKATGVGRDRLVGSDFSEYFSNPDQARAGYRQVFTQGHVTDYPLQIRHVSGRLTDVLYNATVYRDEAGNVAGVFAAARDITKLKESQQELEKNHQEILTLGQMTDLLQSCNAAEEAFPIINATLRYLFPDYSGALFLREDGETPFREVFRWGDSVHGEPQLFLEDCWALRRGHSHVVKAGASLNPRCKHLEKEEGDYACLPLMAQGKPLGIVYLSPESSWEISERAGQKLRLAETMANSISLALANLRLRESLRQLSIKDPLTGLYNRRFLEETLERELLRLSLARNNLVVAIFDIDKFKDFNDTFGHDIGDLVLQEFARLMLCSHRGTDVACRYGGEEFVLVLPEISLETAVERLEQLRDSFAALRLNVHGKNLPAATVSVGMAVYPRHGVTAASLIKAADNALYRAKHSGRNRLVSADGLQEDIAAPGGQPV